MRNYTAHFVNLLKSKAIQLYVVLPFQGNITEHMICKSKAGYSQSMIYTQVIDNMNNAIFCSCKIGRAHV